MYLEHARNAKIANETMVESHFPLLRQISVGDEFRQVGQDQID